MPGGGRWPACGAAGAVPGDGRPARARTTCPARPAPTAVGSYVRWQLGLGPGRRPGGRAAGRRAGRGGRLEPGGVGRGGPGLRPAARAEGGRLVVVLAPGGPGGRGRLGGGLPARPLAAGLDLGPGRGRRLRPLRAPCPSASGPSPPWSSWASGRSPRRPLAADRGRPAGAPAAADRRPRRAASPTAAPAVPSTGRAAGSARPGRVVEKASNIGSLDRKAGSRVVMNVDGPVSARNDRAPAPAAEAPSPVPSDPGRPDAGRTVRRRFSTQAPPQRRVDNSDSPRLEDPRPPRGRRRPDPTPATARPASSSPTRCAPHDGSTVQEGNRSCPQDRI